MIKKQKKWIALLAMVTFVWLLQVSARPLAASETSEQIAAADTEPGPNFVERTGVAGPAAAKKSVLPYVLIGVGVVAVVAVLFLVVLKTDYDITGSWDFVFTVGSTSATLKFTFTGTKDSGSYMTAENPMFTGSYTVDKKNVSMTINNDPTIQFSGQFTEKDKMTGIYIQDSSNLTWTATRGAAASLVNPTSERQALLFSK